MRAMSTETMQNIISYVDQYFCDKHTTPSVNEIALGVGIPKTTAFRYLVEMDNRGMLEYDGKSRTIRTPMIKKFAPDSAPCPLVGSIPVSYTHLDVYKRQFYFSMRTLSFTKKKDEIIARLNVLADSYDSWIQEKLVHDSKMDDAKFKNEIGNSIIEKCEEALGRIRAGIQLLVDDDVAFDAFCVMTVSYTHLGTDESFGLSERLWG